MQVRKGVLLMAYGTPETPDQVEPYFTHIRGGRKPSPEAVSRLQTRYEKIGGRTPLLEITNSVARKLESVLSDSASEHVKVYVGMKHWHPYIADTLASIVADGITHLTAIVLAPHYSLMSVGGYRKAVQEGLSLLGADIPVTFVERWHQQPEFVELMSKLILEGLNQFSEDERGNVVPVFSAHSLPEKIRNWGDPYEAELHGSSKMVADNLNRHDWRFAWQSAGETGDPWLGPDILDFLDVLKSEGASNVLQIPIGFVCDHLEIMWDIDYEAKNKAAELGITLHRTQLPNDSDDFVNVIASVFRGAQDNPESYIVSSMSERV